MKKERLIRVLTVLVLIGILSFVAFPKTGFVISQTINANQLENLKLNAQVECLQNSQCSENQECIENRCINKNEIDICKNIGFSTYSRSLKNGDSINSIKSVLTKADLPYLLSNGKLAEIIDRKLIEYFYSPVLIIGDNKIEKESQDYMIENSEPVYTYKLTFSNPVDFSNKNLHGQIIKIFGEEYVIDKNSKNSNIELVSKKKNIVLKNSENIKITEDENGNIISIEIEFNSPNKIKIKENYSESLFNKIKLSFDKADSEFVDIKIGGNC